MSVDPHHSPVSADPLQTELKTTSIAGGIFTITLSVYAALNTLHYTVLNHSLMLLALLSIGTFSGSLLNLILDKRQMFTGWMYRVSWFFYGTQAGIVVLIGLAVYATAQAPRIGAAGGYLGVVVVWNTMIGVAMWFVKSTVGDRQTERYSDS